MSIYNNFLCQRTKYLQEFVKEEKLNETVLDKAIDELTKNIPASALLTRHSISCYKKALSESLVKLPTIILNFTYHHMDILLEGKDIHFDGQCPEQFFNLPCRVMFYHLFGDLTTLFYRTDTETKFMTREWKIYPLIRQTDFFLHKKELSLTSSLTTKNFSIQLINFTEYEVIVSEKKSKKYLYIEHTKFELLPYISEIEFLPYDNKILLRISGVKNDIESDEYKVLKKEIIHSDKNQKKEVRSIKLFKIFIEKIIILNEKISSCRDIVMRIMKILFVLENKNKYYIP